ncbi:hypothetical protein F2P81_011945 [Scophthalmus maximus]|uniref:SRCR domain-containing protein n=1 Tax=Scophthalmus maximus TaxID=52904 RepID=A0A6A4SRL6_SCOMX|nr:hypothetical protein F2P81_011945 [Scophthalmus maximus]
MKREDHLQSMKTVQHYGSKKDIIENDKIILNRYMNEFIFTTLVRQADGSKICAITRTRMYGEERLILRGGREPCHGHAEIYYKNKWGYIGDKHWNRATEEVVCRSTHCGSPVESAMENELRPINSTLWLNEVTCSGEENHLLHCKYPGWGLWDAYRVVKWIECSSEDELLFSFVQTHNTVCIDKKYSFKLKDAVLQTSCYA